MLEFKSRLLNKDFENILHLFQNKLDSNSIALNPQDQKGGVIAKIITSNSLPENRNRIQSEFSGFGPLDFLLGQTGINEIIINGREHIFYEKQGEMQALSDCFLSDITFHHIVEKICTQAHITVNINKPYSEGKWKDFRVFILRPPIVKKDFHLCLRRQAKELWTFEKLKPFAPDHAIEILRNLVKQKQNFLIAGPTSAGKTAVLNACLQELDPYERVITIEDSDEIVLPNPVSTKLLTQRDSESLKLLIDQQDLVKQSLRLRPDRIVMGEVRGAEAKDLLMALATGHQGSIGTLHARDHKQAIWKLETLAQMGASQWQSSTVQRLIYSSLQALVILDKRGGSRLLKGLYKIAALESSGFLFETLYERAY